MNSKNDKTGFVYCFDMGEEIPHFEIFPEHIQSSAECSAVNVIYESFVLPADQDYLMSRLLAQKGLPRGFYWAAAQAIEKYLKAFLLMNGKSVKTFKGHPLKDLFEAATQIDSSLADVSILPHQSIEVESSISEFLRRFKIKEYMSELARHGSADNRYNAFGVEYNTGHLFAMDSLSFKLRESIGVIPIHTSFKYLDVDLIRSFNNNNPWFSKEEISAPDQIQSNMFSIEDSASVTKLEVLYKNKGNVAYGLALKWLGRKMKLPTINGNER